MSVTGTLYRLARLSATASAVASGRPQRLARRARNIVVGRVLARVLVRLWR